MQLEGIFRVTDPLLDFSWEERTTSPPAILTKKHLGMAVVMENNKLKHHFDLNLTEAENLVTNLQQAISAYKQLDKECTEYFEEQKTKGETK